MTISWFCVWNAEAGETPAPDIYDRQGLTALLQGCPGMTRGHVMLPVEAHDPYYAERAGSPVLVLQVEFADISALEDCLRPDGYLGCLADPDSWPSLAGTTASHQAMLTRRYPVADPAVTTADGSSLSYMVEYAGPAADENLWHRFYMDQHPRLLAKFPGIRAIEIYTPATVVCGLPFRERRAMQRNKTVFDDAEAMNAAMKTPVREALRADFNKLPPFQGESDHYPFRSLAICPRSQNGG